MFLKSKNLCLAALTVLTLNFGQVAQATCAQSIEESDYKHNRVPAYIFSGVTAAAGAITATPYAAPMAAVALSTVAAAQVDRLDDLSVTESYAYEVLVETEVQGVSPIEANFVKAVQRKVAEDRNAVIPTFNEVIGEIESMNYDLSACTDEGGNFFRPTKDDIIEEVISQF